MSKVWPVYIVILGPSVFYHHTTKAVPLIANAASGPAIFQSASYPFANGDSALGWVCLNGGCSVPAASSVTFNMIAPVAGPINLNGTGAILLAGDLQLASTASLPSGGIIAGQGYSVMMQGDLTIPAGTVLYLTTNTTIDGGGHTLTFEGGSPGGQIYIDGTTTTVVTLRNMTINGVQNYTTGGSSIGIISGPGVPTVVLDNVTINLAGPTSFGNATTSNAALVINRKVTIAGGYDFAFGSAANCTINTASTLLIDLNTTFAYLPGDSLATHMVFQDSSATLALNGATWYALNTIGTVLTGGNLLINNKSSFQSNGATASNKPIQLGNGVQADNMAINILAGGSINVVEAFVRYNNIEAV